MLPWKMSSSFVRKSEQSAASSAAVFNVRYQQHIPPSCKITIAGNLVASTGITSLDTLLGEGLPVGKIVLLLEDQPRSSSNYANTILKCFIAQGLVAGNEVVYVGEDSEKIAASLPGKSSRTDQEFLASNPSRTATPVESPTLNKEKMSIAWRYKHIHQVESALQPNQPETYGNSFDLAKRTDPSDLMVIDPPSLADEGLMKLVEEHTKLGKPEGLLRIAIRSFGSPLFNPKDLLRQFYTLRASIRANRNVVLMLTLPGYLQSREFLSTILGLCDAVFEVQSFAGTPKESEPAFKEYQGFFRVIKSLRVPDSLALVIPETRDLAFKCKQRRFVIEKFHLPPELRDNASRSPATGPACSQIVDF